MQVYFNKGRSRRLLGRYRLPKLEPVFPSERELNQTKIRALREWLAKPELQKLETCLRKPFLIYTGSPILSLNSVKFELEQMATHTCALPHVRTRTGSRLAGL